ncbi:hypothetical protein [Streptomyces sp. NPDC057854]|uniref:hypothetical protein n=1 Tax=unclassified Streptomyces TaxID=2593676 RepID=UPI00367A3596
MATQRPERDDQGAEERVSMSELLASCAAASAVSTPPRTTPAEDSEDSEAAEERRDRAA